MKFIIAAAMAMALIIPFHTTAHADDYGPAETENCRDEIRIVTEDQETMQLPHNGEPKRFKPKYFKRSTPAGRNGWQKWFCGGETQWFRCRRSSNENSYSHYNDMKATGNESGGHWSYECHKH